MGKFAPLRIPQCSPSCPVRPPTRSTVEAKKQSIYQQWLLRRHFQLFLERPQSCRARTFTSNMSNLFSARQLRQSSRPLISLLCLPHTTTQLFCLLIYARSPFTCPSGSCSYSCLCSLATIYQAAFIGTCKNKTQFFILLSV
jgi:hypothetical protein